MKSTENGDVKPKRLPYAFIAVLVAAVLLSSSIQFFTAHRIITSQQEHMMGRELEILKAMAEDAFKSGDDISLLTHLEFMKNNRAFHHVCLIDTNGIIRISSNPRLNGAVYFESLFTKYLRPLRGSHTLARYEYNDDRGEGGSITETGALLINPITSETSGYAVIGFRTAALTERSWRAGMWFLLTACAVIIAGVAVILYVRRKSGS